MEQWKSVKGYEGHYEVSNLGNVRSINRIDSIGRKRKSVTLKPSKNTEGYFGVNLCKDGIVTYTRLHKIVAINFLTKQAEDDVVNHINGIKHDNRLENLEYCTQKQNLNKCIYYKQRNTNLNSLSDKEIIEIMKSYYESIKQRNEKNYYVLEKYNITSDTLRQIVNRTSDYMQRIPIQNFELQNTNKSTVVKKENKEIIDLRKHGFYLTEIAKVYEIDLGLASRICKYLNLNRKYSKYHLI